MDELDTGAAPDTDGGAGEADSWFNGMTGRDTSEPEPETAEEVETDSADVVESEGDPDDEPEGNPDDEPAEEAATSDAGPDEEAPLLAGKYKGVEELEKGYRSASAEASRLAQQVQQLQHELQTALITAQQAQVQTQVSQHPPRFEALTPEVQAQVEHLSSLEGLEPQAWLTLEWRHQKAQAEQQAAMFAHQQQQQQAAFQQTAQAVVAYADEHLSPYGDQALSEFDSHPEVFQAMRQLGPEALARFGPRYVDLLKTEQEHKRLKAEVDAKVEAARKAVREEISQNRKVKQSATTEASRSRTVTASSPRATSTPAASKINELLAFQGQEVW